MGSLILSLMALNFLHCMDLLQTPLFAFIFGRLGILVRNERNDDSKFCVILYFQMRAGILMKPPITANQY